MAVTCPPVPVSCCCLQPYRLSETCTAVGKQRSTVYIYIIYNDYLVFAEIHFFQKKIIGGVIVKMMKKGKMFRVLVNKIIILERRKGNKFSLKNMYPRLFVPKRPDSYPDCTIYTVTLAQILKTAHIYREPIL